MTKEDKNGKHRIILKYKDLSVGDTSAIIFNIIYNSAYPVEFIHRYYTVKSIKDIKEYTIDDSLKAIRLHSNSSIVRVSFNEILNIQKEEGYSITYLVQAFNQFYLKYSHIVESIYPSNDFTLFSTNLTGEYQGKLSTSFEVDSSEKLFVNVIAFITKDNFEDRILYSHVLVENEPAPEPEPEPEPPSRTYILSKVFQSFTQNANEEKLFVLDKKVEDENVFKIELMIEENKLSDKQYLDFTIEPKQDFPVYANSSEVKLINYTTEYEKKIFIFSSTKSLMINFFIENSSNDEKNIT